MMWKRIAISGILVLFALSLVGCGGGVDSPVPPVETMKIEDRPGMLGGESKPDPFGADPAVQADEDDEVEPAWQASIIRANDSAYERYVGYNRVFWCECSIPANGVTFVVTLQPLETDEDSDLYVFRPADGGMERIGYSRRGHAGNSLATPDWVAFEAFERGRHQIGLFGYSPTTPGDLNDFRVEVDRATELVVDGAAKSKDVAAGESRWYYFAATAGIDYSVTLTSNSGDADLFVYEDASDELVGQSTNSSGPDTVGVMASDSVRHYLRVYGAMTSDFSVSVAAVATVQGDVRDLSDDQPLEGATVTVGGKSDVTDASGQYSINQVPTGDQPIEVTKDGYEVAGSLPATVTVSAPTTVLATIYMIESGIEPPPGP